MAGSKKKKAPKIPIEELGRLKEEAKRAIDAERRRVARETAKVDKKLAKETAAKEAADKAEASNLEFERELDKETLASRKKELDQINVRVAKNEDWDQWVACIPLPDIDDLSSLNTYLSLSTPDPEEDLLDDPKAVCQPRLDKCYNNEQVITLLTNIYGKAKEEGDEEKIKWYKNFSETLRDNTQADLDKVTISYLHLADEYFDENSPQDMVEMAAACPRRMELKPLPPFDWLPDLQEEKSITDDTKEEEPQERDEEKEPMRVISYPPPLEGHDVPEMYLGIWVHISNRERVKSVEFKGINLEITQLPLALQQTRTCIRVFMASYDHYSGKKKRPEPEGKKKKRKKLQRFTSVGGIVNIEQLAVPTQPKAAKGFTIREHSVLSEQLSIQPYPTKVEGTSSSDPTPPLEIKYTIPKFVMLKDNSPHFGLWHERSGIWEEDGVEANGYDPETRVAKLKISTLRPFAVIQPRALDFPYRDWSLHPTGANTAMLSVTGSRFEVKLELVGGKVRLLQPEHPTLTPIHKKLLDPGVLLLRLARTGINLAPSDEDAEFCRKPLKNTIESKLHEELSMAACMFEIRGSAWNSARGTKQCMFKIKLSDTPCQKGNEVGPDSVYQAPTAPVLEEKKEEEPEEEEEEVIESDSDCGEDGKVCELFPEWLQIATTPDRFFITQSDDKKFNNVIMEGQQPHTSLRRCLSAYFNHPDVLDRTKIDVMNSFPQVDRSSQCLALQQTMRRTLNLLRVFTFY